jgi:CHASE2 domain-containing sensor protein/two-component sensor histidine kinase
MGWLKPPVQPQGRGKLQALRAWALAELQTWRLGAVPGLVVIAVVSGVRQAGGLQMLELVALDEMLRSRPAEQVDPRITIVGLTESDIQQFKTYPVSDRDLAGLISQIQGHQPTVIGLDLVRDLPVAPGQAALRQVLQTSPNLIATDIALPNAAGLTVAAPAAAQQVGFADIPLDPDGRQRRSLLAFSPAPEEFRYGLPLLLAAEFLNAAGVPLENGRRNPEALRFGDLELDALSPQFGSYLGADAGGHQLLLNPRQAKFRVVSWGDILAGRVEASWLRQRIVLIGVMAISTKDLATSRAIAPHQPGQLYGVEMHAQATSQLISAVLDRRPLLNSWSDWGEYGWILGWGMVGIGLGRWLRSPWQILLGWVGASASLVGMSYGLLLAGWWVPWVPAILSLSVNGTGLAALLFYRHERQLQLRLEERQLVIEQTFQAIHNGPLQTLASMLRQGGQGHPELQQLNQELRSIYTSVQREAEAMPPQIGGAHLDLAPPMHDLLYQVYANTLKRDLPHFQTIQVKIVQIDPLNPQGLRPEQQRSLCRFLEEAICNVGKHAVGATRLTVVGMQQGSLQILRVMDNGQASNAPVEQESPIEKAAGLGTKLAQNLAKQLGGQFRRYQPPSGGTVCELSWPVSKR